MHTEGYSKTAMGTAFMRAYHATHDCCLIFNDFLAPGLISEEERLAAEERHIKALQVYEPAQAALCRDPAQALACWMQNAGAPAIVLARARYNEDILEQGVRQGVRQYVILGAGMDTFAWRRPDLLAHLQVLEIDYPATQAHKRRRFQKAGLQPPAGLHFLPLDFNEGTLESVLRGSAYDPQAPTIFSWLGVTYYLPLPAILATWRAISLLAPPGSAIIFDYLEADAFIPGRVARRVEVMKEIVQRIGEPMITGFAPAALAADLAGQGLRLQENLGPAEIQARFFQGRPDNYRACEQVYFALAVVG
jgi:methyltransferase (TIGR00027 family)|uniref:S-adenosyl-L-methionine-dependent methyltransferase n=1 Tax=Desulfobacca acetoxidans TaxID=60893 RepID=A0A7V6DQW4_9BACT